MKFTVVVDNFCSKVGLLSEWGYSAFLETQGGNVLIDTSMHGSTLIHNLKALKINPASIKNIFLSHGHFDHCGGLGELLTYTPSSQIWCALSIATLRWVGRSPEKLILEGGGQLLKLAGLNKVEDIAEILPGVTAFTVPDSFRNPDFINKNRMWETDKNGTIIPDTFSDDISLLVEGEHGYSLLLGCAHAGLSNILRYAIERFEVKSFYSVIGGMHFASLSASALTPILNDLQNFNVQCWRPSHCTGFQAGAGISARFPNVMWAGAGTQIIL